MNNIVSKMVSLLTAFMLFFVAPFVTVSAELEMLSRRLLIEDVCYFVDTVIDSREISDELLREFNVTIASYGVNVHYDITLYHRAVSATGDDDYVVTFISDNDFSTLKQGDKISIHFYTTGSSLTNSLAGKISGVFVGGMDEVITARVR